MYELIVVFVVSCDIDEQPWFVLHMCLFLRQWYNLCVHDFRNSYCICGILQTRQNNNTDMIHTSEPSTPTMHTRLPIQRIRLGAHWGPRVFNTRVMHDITIVTSIVVTLPLALNFPT